MIVNALSKSRVDVNAPVAVSASVLLSVVGGAAFLIMPLLIGAAAVDFGLSDSQLGYLAASIMAGSVISALLAIFWVRTFSWRRIMIVGLLTAGLGHGSAILADSYGLLLLAMFVASFGGGTCYSLALTILSDNEKSDQVFGYSIAAQVSFQVVGLLLLPGIVSKGGLDAILAILSSLAFISLFVCRYLPVHGNEQPISRVFQVFLQPNVMFALLGCLFFFVNVGSFWAFIERIGTAAGYDPQVIGNSLAAGVAVGIIGSLSASWLGDRYGRIRPITMAAIGTVISAALLLKAENLIIFVAAIALYNFVWNFSLTYQYAVVAAADKTGRGVAIAPAFHALGAVLGPAVAGIIIITDNYMAVSVIVAVSVVISLFFFIPACGNRAR